MSRQTTEEEFWSRAETQGDCLVWTWGKDKDGYGKLRWEGRHRRAHQIAYELSVGPIPDGLMVCHTCDNPSCVLPGHLFVSDSLGNMLDMSGKRRGRGQHKTHCPAGHAYDEENTYIYRNNNRGCRKCRLDQWRAWYARQAATIGTVPVAEDRS